MTSTQEIKALLFLIDDTDIEVTKAVEDRIINIGNDVIPYLEHLWECTIDNHVQDKIEGLIHQLHYKNLQSEFLNWGGHSYNDLLFGSLLASKYQYPSLDATVFLSEIDKLKKTVWLELNDYLTPLEQANVLSRMLYGYFKIEGKEINYDCPDNFLMNKLIEKKEGNAISIGILYQILCDVLDINASIINIPNQLIIAFYHSDYYASNESFDDRDKIHFYVDALNGQAYTYNDIKKYFRRMNIEIEEKYFKPQSHKQIIKLLLTEVSKCFYKSSLSYKQQEVVQLVQLLK